MLARTTRAVARQRAKRMRKLGCVQCRITDHDIQKLALLLLVLKLSIAEDPSPLTMEGQYTIGVVMHMRDEAPDGNCRRPIKLWSLQEIASMEWALTTINNQTDEKSSVGLTIYDSCGNSDRILRQTTELTKENPNSPLIGVIAAGNVPEISSVASLLHAYSVPLILTKNPEGKHLRQMDNIFTTAPHFLGHIKSILALTKEYNEDFGPRNMQIAIFSYYAEVDQMVRSQASKGSRKIQSITVSKNATIIAIEFAKIISDSKNQVGAVVALMDAEMIAKLPSAFEEIHFNVNVPYLLWVFAVLDGPPANEVINVRNADWKFNRAVIIKPDTPMIPLLQRYLNETLDYEDSLVKPLVPLVERSTLSKQDSNADVLSNSWAVSLVKAVSSLLAAFSMGKLQVCPNVDQCPAFTDKNITKGMIPNMKKLSYFVHGSGDNIRYTADGHFMTTFVISYVTPTGLVQIGRYKEGAKAEWFREENLLNTGSQTKFSDGLKLKDHLKPDYSSYQPVQKTSTRPFMYRGLIILVICLPAAYLLNFLCVYYRYMGIYFVLYHLCEMVTVAVAALPLLTFMLEENTEVCTLRRDAPILTVCVYYMMAMVMVFSRRSQLMRKVPEYKDHYFIWIACILFCVGGGMLFQRERTIEEYFTPQLFQSGHCICNYDSVNYFLTPFFVPGVFLFLISVEAANVKYDPDAWISEQHSHLWRASRRIRLFLSQLMVICAWIMCSYYVDLKYLHLMGILFFFIFTINTLVHFCTCSWMLPEVKYSDNIGGDSTRFISTVEAQLDSGPEAVRPPAPFCDPPRYASYKQELPVMRPWRMGLHDSSHIINSPIIRRNILPPAPPPPKSAYLGTRLYDNP